MSRAVDRLKAKAAALEANLSAIRADIAELEGVDDGPSAMDLSGFLDLDLPSEAWMLPGLVPVSSIGILAAAGGTGKTAFAVQLGLCLADARPFIGKTPSRAWRVLHVLYEGSARLFQDRVRAAVAMLRYPDQGSFAWHVAPPIGELHRLGTAGLESIIRKSRADLVVLDTMTLAARGLDEKDPLSWKEKVLHPIVDLKAASGASFLLVHHQPLAREGPRGTTAMRDDVDYVWLLKRDEDEERVEDAQYERQTLTIDKERYAMSHYSIALEYEPKHAFYRRMA